MLNSLIGGQGNNAGRNTLKNRFGKSSARFQLAGASFQFIGHFIESSHQRGKLVNGIRPDTVGQVPPPDFMRPSQQGGNRNRYLPRQNLRGPGGKKKYE